ncbi:hypothetical protein GGE68_001435 [Rhizobium leguminosarum]|uniref:hypothetical protein n=1 Tax=Rhizobium leguminosarum TaxID=384 RepID=UPI00160B3572|nr:hypothetical protein [Rhizobium leguminosarum]MBB5663259.1 hypothetical protein [Rhizobium leguminosarum]
MRIAIANSAEVDAIWPSISDKIIKATLKYGSSVSSGDLWQMCRAGNAFLVVVFDGEEVKGALIMQFQRWASKQVMYCLAIVGDDIQTWLPDARAFITDMAKAGGAESFIAEGREGWPALFPDAKKLRITYEVPL